MAGNFLQDILGQFSNVPDPSYMQPAPQSYSNVLTQAQPMAYGAAPQTYPPQAPERQRASVIDILGGLADSIAEMGGSTPGYQPTLDAATERRRQAEGDQMARQEFGLKQQRYGLDNRKAQFDMQQDQNEVLGQAAGVLRHALQTQGAAGAERIFGILGSRLGMAPEQLQAELAHFRSDPASYTDALEAFAKAKNGGNAKYGTTPRFIVNPATGETRWVQISDAGGANPVVLPEGFVPDPRIQFEDTGLGIAPLSKNTGGGFGTPTPRTGDLGQGIALTTPPGGGAPVVTPLQGGKQDIELTKDVRDLQTLDAALGSFESIFPDVKNNIDAMARAGSLSGVPPDATDAEGRPIRGGSNLGAIAMQNVPFLEQATNNEGFSARQQIDSAGRTMVQQLGPLLTQAQNSGANLTSRMMDTPKELEGLLAQAINTKDYVAANKAYERFKTRYGEVRKEVQAKLTAAQKRTAQGRQQPSGNAPAAPTVSNW